MALLAQVWFGTIAVLLGLLVGPEPGGTRVQVSESDIKAAFLYNFTKYIEWPPGAFLSASEPFRVCVLAADGQRQTIDSFMTGETVQGRQIQTLVPRPTELPRCHLLFIGREAAARERTVLAAIAKRPVLTVGETPAFLDEGGVVRFHVENQRVRFDLHLDAAARAGLTVSSKLLRVAHEVREAPPR